MKIYLISCLLVCASALHGRIIKTQWEFYKAEHGKEYRPSVEAHHFKNFIQSTITIEEHNARYHRGEVGYKLGHNQFSDLSHKDMKRKFFGRRKINIEGYYNFTEISQANVAALPDSIDWREKVTEVKDQGQCGSCFAFATVALVESAIVRNFSVRLDLSEQQIVDCSYKFQSNLNDGCDGGHEVITFNYIINNGINTEGHYPYVSGILKNHEMCKQDSDAGEWGRDLIVYKVQNDEDELAKALVAHGPLLVSTAADNDHIKQYSQGIFHHSSCAKQVDHNALLVGYGTEKGNQYWLIKNSFGANWGEKGYLRLLRGVNQCGIVTDNAYYVEIPTIPKM